MNNYNCLTMMISGKQRADYRELTSLINTTFTGQWFASGFLQTPPHDDTLALGYILPTAGRIRDFPPLERAPAGRTKKITAQSGGNFSVYVHSTKTL